MADESESKETTGSISRRELLKRAGVGAGGVALAGTIPTAAWARANGTTKAAANTIKLGFISPITGPAAGFGEGDPYIIGLAKKAFAKGLTVAGTRYDVEIVSKDSQSDPARCAQVANDLIHSENVDLLLATSTPESVNPASDAAEAAQVPSIATIVPW
ncbi:MAG: ABC transporter substrate-binding protein, partial [Gaiellaceae bacterium]